MDNHPKIALVGEAFGVDEEIESRETGRPTPFVGAAGRHLDTMLKSAGIDRAQCLVTNVFNFRPPANNIEAVLVPKKEAEPGWPALRRGKYLPPSLLPEIVRLHTELADYNPDVIVPLGSIALWSLCKVTGLANRHGFLHRWEAWAPPGEGPPYPTPVLPTWHPAGILRKYTQFIPAVNDLRKAIEVAQGNRAAEAFDVIDEPTIEDVRGFRDWLFAQDPLPVVSTDIETKPKYRSITHIGIGTSSRALCIPLWDETKVGQAYWKTPEEEVEAIQIAAEILQDPRTTKVLQNALYDIAWYWTVLGIKLAGPVIDTRLEHFALFPELPHSLAEIATTWLHMTPWKMEHKGSGKDGDASASEEGGE